MLLTDKKVCANCAYRYQKHSDLNYDHFEPDRCKKQNDGRCSDIWNTTCDLFQRKVNKKENE